MGLVIAKQQVEMMVGNIQVSSTEQTGSEFTFSVELPSSSEAVEAKPEAERWPDARLTDGQTVQTFIVDDVETNRDLLTRMLGRIAVTVDTADNGRRAGEAVHPDHDIIFMDIRMPEMSGTEALERIHEQHGADRYKIVAVTASAFEHQRRAFLEMGFDGFIDKPVSMRGVVSTTTELLDLDMDFVGWDGEAGDVERSWTYLTIPADLHESLMAAVDELRITDLRRYVDALEELGERQGLAAQLRELSAGYNMEAIRKVVSGLGVAKHT